MEERRKSPRHGVHGLTATIPTTVNVQLLDVSQAGVLLASAQPFEVGTEASLTLNLGGAPFKANVHVQRAAAGPQAGHRLGATFVALSPDRRQLIERFIAQ